MKKKDVGFALRLVSNLIHSLGRSGAEGKEARFDTGRFIAFNVDDKGGFALDGKEADLYVRCVDAMVEAYNAMHARGSSVSLISRNVAEKMLQRAICEVTEPYKPDRRRPGSAEFEQALRGECDKLQSTLSTPPTEWVIVSPVRGIDDESQPFVVGLAEFSRATQERAQSLADRIGEYTPPPEARASEETVERDRLKRSRSRARLVSEFSKGWTATLRASAFDQKAASSLALNEIRTSVEVINFFLPFLEKVPDSTRVIIPPETNRLPILNIAYPSRGEGFHKNQDFSHRRLPAKIPDIRSGRAKEVGMARVSDMLGKPSRTDLEERIVTAISWAGRANIELHRETSFLYCVISLETLLAKEGARGGVTERIKRRVSNLLGRSPKVKEIAYDEMGSLYGIRSRIVHAGYSAGLTDVEFNQVRRLCQHAITAILTHEDYKDMSLVRELEDWLDQKEAAAP